jgi:hypothetical protein
MDNEDGMLLVGARAIAAFLGLTLRQTQHRISDGVIPTLRIGASVCARRESLLRWLERGEMETQAQARERRAARRARNRAVWVQRNARKSDNPAT